VNGNPAGTAALATRARKARHRSACALCPVPVITGQRIGYLPAAGWAHVQCIIAANRQELDALRILMTTPPRPGRGPGDPDEPGPDARNGVSAGQGCQQTPLARNDTPGPLSHPHNRRSEVSAHVADTSALTYVSASAPLIGADDDDTPDTSGRDDTPSQHEKGQ